MEGEIQDKSESREMTQQSLLTALSRFVQAVDAMDDAVMIPSKLRDMEVLHIDDDIIREVNNNNSSSSNSNNTKALLPALPAGADMYSFYSMLNAVKSEIITGPSNETADENCDSTAADDAVVNVRKTAQAFRHHLSGLFDVLHQMTETAKYLKCRYETEVTQSSSKVSTFTI
ncbi:mid1-interacting protein 1A-like [Gigantopelta aegis]|uniref:mid1-interacting protein 1A-like n=1 Tax=Gigantopelta aegis TaxID=1735272 RepID=UPI001B88E44F|nr:mid1-interacting protein 1A-like [Gigantopelta aegis]